MTVFSISRESERDSYQKSLWLGSVPWTCHDEGYNFAAILHDKT